jgi:accessory colonization factor AcfC
VIFLKNVVGSTVVMEGDGIIEQYAGSYDDYLLQKQDTLKLAQITNNMLAFATNINPLSTT